MQRELEKLFRFWFLSTKLVEARGLKVDSMIYMFMSPFVSVCYNFCSPGREGVENVGLA